jgi:hypothetical protein
MIEIRMVHLVRAHLRPHHHSQPPWISAFCLPIGLSHPEREDAHKDRVQRQIMRPHIAPLGHSRLTK